jgi:hypothetical protein
MESHRRILYSLWRSLWCSFRNPSLTLVLLVQVLIFSWQCRLSSCSDDTVAQFLAGAEIFCFHTGFGVNPASYPMVKHSEEVKLTTHLYQMPNYDCMELYLPTTHLPIHPPAYVLPLISERKLCSRTKQWLKLKFVSFNLYVLLKINWRLFVTNRNSK